MQPKVRFFEESNAGRTMFFQERVLIRTKYVCIKLYANTLFTSRVIGKNRPNYDKVSRESQAC